ncbi:hypothetical protein FJZ18_00840 [Candidatus Pacearchaeota archaeon]|nr:hypothetical protein [Candidatus Pacearchaeota archaeon]
MKKSLAFFIPGAGQRQWGLLLQRLSIEGYNPEPIIIDWRRGNFREWLCQINEHVSSAIKVLGNLGKGERFTHERNIAIGFSYGGILTLHISRDLKLRKYCCSTPNFYNIGLRRKFDKLTNRTAGFKTDWNEFDALPSPDGRDTIFVYAEKDLKDYCLSSHELSFRFKSTTYCAPNAEHNINSLEYISSLQYLIELDDRRDRSG